MVMAQHTTVHMIQIAILLCIAVLSLGSLPEDEKVELLDTHNQCRGDVIPTASNMEEMEWDDNLATVAQAYAEECIWEHNSDRTSQVAELTDEFWYVGENLAVSSNGAYDSTSWAVTAWDAEKEFYDYYTGDCTSVCGHYTQVAWASSQKVGCGYALCDSMEGISWCSYYGGCEYVVCNYGPGGNIVGAEMYESGESCSNCPSDMPYCVENLCSATGSGTETVIPTSESCVSATEACSENSDCCTGKCKNSGTCRCAQAEEYCYSDADCCDGMCSNNVCKDETTESDACIDDHLTCESDSDCCSGNCNSDKECQAESVTPSPTVASTCVEEDESCSNDEECCSGNCNKKNKCKAASEPTATPTPSPTSTPTSVSGGYCEGYCGRYSWDGSCWCDRHCTFYGDCCSDICDTCRLGCMSQTGVIAKVMDRPEDFDPKNVHMPWLELDKVQEEEIKGQQKKIVVLSAVFGSGLVAAVAAYVRKKPSVQGYTRIL